MRKKIKSIAYAIVVAIVFFSAASSLTLAKEEGSLIKELSVIDAFHPPAIDDPKIQQYNEWHYFNVIDEEQGISFVTTLRLSGNIYNPATSFAGVLISYNTPLGTETIGDTFLITDAEYSDTTPDVRMGSNTVRLDDDGYHLHIESVDGQTVFNGLFKPQTESAPLFTAPLESELSREVLWLVASPKMKVTGTLTINKGTPEEETYKIKNARGYHDHNWGYWAWGDDLGWDWGQGTESKNHLNGNDVGKYAFTFGNVTNNNHTESRNSVLSIWKNRKIIADFNEEEIQIQHYAMNTIPPFSANPFPSMTVLSATSAQDSISIVFTTEHPTPLPILLEGGQYLVIWEIYGTYEVNGSIDGKAISYTTEGFLEYVR